MIVELARPERLFRSPRLREDATPHAGGFSATILKIRSTTIGSGKPPARRRTR
jgi:hypothetical protein